MSIKTACYNLVDLGISSLELPYLMFLDTTLQSLCHSSIPLSHTDEQLDDEWLGDHAKNFPSLVIYDIFTIYLRCSIDDALLWAYCMWVGCKQEGVHCCKQTRHKNNSMLPKVCKEHDSTQRMLSFPIWIWLSARTQIAMPSDTTSLLGHWYLQR